MKNGMFHLMSAKVPKVAVILTSWNRDELLRQAIQSVVMQTFVDWHLWIMDDDSDNPRTHEILDYYAKHPQITVQKKQLGKVDRYSRVGYAENIDIAIEMSESAYISYLTCDDIYYPNHLSECVELLDNAPTCFVCYGVNNTIKLFADGRTRYLYKRDKGLFVEWAATHIDHCQVMHRRECVDMCGTPLWKTSIENMGCGDAQVWEKFNAHWEFWRVHSPVPTVEHRMHGDSIQGRAS